MTRFRGGKGAAVSDEMGSNAATRSKQLNLRMHAGDVRRTARYGEGETSLT